TNGLALSSRNRFRDDAQRSEAPQLYTALEGVKARIKEGHTDPEALERHAIDHLRSRGWTVDYVSLRRQRDLLVPTATEISAGEPLVVLAAAKLGTTRLIDNLEI